MHSSIFLNEVTVIDHAFINDEGIIMGGSFMASFQLSGEIDRDESVVVDFSTGKHEVKSLIDRHTSDNKSNGFDHKLWILEGYSNCIYEIKDSYYIIVTPNSRFVLPLDAVKIFESLVYGVNIGSNIEDFLNSNLSFKVKCILTEQVTNLAFGHKYSHPYKFRYVHGLKNSTSYGCQSLCHGHLSYFLIDDIESNNIEIQKYLNNAIFINSENIIDNHELYITISYNTSRGNFEATYEKSSYNIIILDTETTIELIAEYIKNKFNIQASFYISEGLNKGAYFA